MLSLNKYIIPITFFLITLSFSCSTQSLIASEKEAQTVVSRKADFKVLKDSNIVYAKGLLGEDINFTKDSIGELKLDVYYPDNNEVKRPLFFFIHGGGFKEGSKDGKAFVKLANYFSSRGWVFVSIDYRLSKHKGTIPKEWREKMEKVEVDTKIKNLNAIYPAVRDAKAGLRWIVHNADAYNIDANNITVSGGSAGAMMAIAAALTQSNNFTNELTLEDDPTLITTHLGTTYKVNTLVSFWGSSLAIDLYETTYGESKSEKELPPILMFHGKYDKIVDPSKSRTIALFYKKLNAPFKLYELEKGGHGLWNAKFKNRRLEEITLDFLIEHSNLKIN